MLTVMAPCAKLTAARSTREKEDPMSKPIARNALRRVDVLPA
jgi:hypothetical protein